MNFDDYSDIVDQMYAAAWLPHRCNHVLNRISESVGAKGTMLCSISHGNIQCLASDSIIGFSSDFFENGWSKGDNWISRTQARHFPGFVRDTDIFTENEREHMPLYNRLLVDHKIGAVVTTVFPLSSDEQAAVIVLGSRKQPVFTDFQINILDNMRPHLERSISISSRLPYIEAEAATRIMESMGLPAAAITSDGKISFSNNLFLSAGTGIQMSRTTGKVRISPERSSKILDQAIEDISKSQYPQTCAIPLRDKKGPGGILHIIPKYRTPHEIFGRRQILLVVSPIGTSAPPPANLLQGLFDLTPAEARVAHAIAGGATLEELAGKLSVSRETLRTQLKMVFSKTGTKRQAELASLILGSLKFSSIGQASDDAHST